MPKRFAIFGALSTSSFATLTFPCSLSATCSTIGACTLQGPHQVAQKSTRVTPFSPSAHRRTFGMPIFRLPRISGGALCSALRYMNATPIRIAVTGAAGAIGYSILFRIAAGEMFGPDQPVIIHLVDIEPALPVLQGV